MVSEGASEASTAASAAASLVSPEGPLVRGAREKWRSWAWATLVFGIVVVHLPALQTPFFLDDYVQIAMADGQYPGRHGALDLYDFIDDSNRRELLDLGVFPWWTDPTL